MMIKSIEQYLSELKKELSKSDPATVQDALSDAEEYLRTALENAVAADGGVSEADALPLIVEKYGLPAEVATAYKDIESMTPPAFGRPSFREIELHAATEPTEYKVPDTRPWYVKFFGVMAEPRAWGALLYLLFALGTGIIYYTWTITGISLSLGLLVLVIGLPFAALFLLSVRGISLVEGRIVEALLGIRMPRRPLFSRKNIGWWERFKDIVADKHNWLSILYMLLQLPLGIIYFTVFITLIALALSGFAIPIIQLGYDIPFSSADGAYYLAVWLMPFIVIGGALLLILTMHLAKFVGRCHGRLAKAMLVRV
jgi:hypothetical protein